MKRILTAAAASFIFCQSFGQATDTLLNTSKGITFTSSGTIKITGGSPGVGKVLTSDAAGNAAWATPSAGNTGIYNVLDYGAIGDSTTDNSAAFNAAIAAMPVRGGKLVIPSGAFRCNSIINVTKTIWFAGSGNSTQVISGDFSSNPTRPTKILTTANINLFYITAPNCKFESLNIENVATTPTSGSGVRLQSNSDGFIMRDCSVFNFYDNIYINHASHYVFDNVTSYANVRYGVYLSNVIAEDAGDGCFSNCFFYAGNRNSAAGIYQASSGGLKMTNCKFNSGGAATYRFYNQVDVAIQNTTDLLISNCSFENYLERAMRITTTGGWTFKNGVISGNQFAAYYPAICDIAISNTKGFIISGNHFDGLSGVPNSILLTNCSNGTLLNNYMDYTGDNVTQSGCSNITDVNSFAPETPPTSYTLALTDTFPINGNLSGYNNWAQIEGSTDATISSKIVNVGPAAGSNVWVNSTSAIATVQNGKITATVNLASGTGIALVFRETDASNFYMLDVGINGSGIVTIQLYKKEGGVYNPIGSQVPTATVGFGVNFALEVSFNGTAFAGVVNGTTYGLPTDATFSAGGKTGLRNGSGGTGNRLVSNYKVYTTN